MRASRLRPLCLAFPAAGLLLAVLLVVVPSARAQQTAAVAGLVQNAASDEPLAGANVLVERLGDGPDVRRGAAAGADGRYRVAGLPSGRYRVRISYLGFEPVEQEVALETGATQRADFVLAPASVQAEGVLVTGDRAAEEAERDLGAERLTPAEIKELPTPFEPDVFRALQLLPGVKAASDFSSGLYIRGGSPDQTLVRLDKTTLYNPTHFFGFFSTFNPDAIGDVRLFKGGFPATYGGRLGSVVDLENRRGSTDDFGGVASLGLLASRVALDGPLPGALSNGGEKDGSWMVAARRSTLEPLFGVLRSQDVEGIPNAFHFYDLNARADTWLSPRDRLTVSGYAGADYIDFPFLEDAEVEITYGNRTGTLEWTHLFGPEVLGGAALSEVSVSASRYFSRPQFQLSGNLFRRTNELTDLAATADLEATFGGHTVRGGVRASAFESALERSLDGNVLFSPNIATGRFSAYAQDTWRPGGRNGDWRVTAGLRAGYRTRGRFLRLAPRLSAQYRPAAFSDRVRLQAGYGRYHQYLSLLTSELFSGADTWYTVAPNVPPAYGDQFVSGVKLDVTDALQLDVEGYYRTMRDLFEIDPYVQDVAGLPYEDAFAFGEGYAWGTEVKLERTAGTLTGFLAYTYAQTRRRFPNINAGEQRVALAGLNAQNALGRPYPPKYDRRHDLKAVVSYDFAAKWRATGVFTYATGQPYTRPAQQYKLFDSPERQTSRDVLASPFNGARLPPYHRLDLGVRRRGTLLGLDYELQVQLLNAYDQRNIWFYFYSFEDDGSVVREEVTQLPIPLPNVALTVEF